MLVETMLKHCLVIANQCMEESLVPLQSEFWFVSCYWLGVVE